MKDGATSQGIQASLEAGIRHGNRFSPGASRRNEALPSETHVTLLASRAVSQYIGVFLSHKGSCHLLKQPQEMTTALRAESRAGICTDL